MQQARRSEVKGIPFGDVVLPYEDLWLMFANVSGPRLDKVIMRTV